MGVDARHAGERGMTLLEVVLALLLFSMMSMMLLSGYADASEGVLRAQIERDMAELLRLRIDLVQLQYKEYEEGAEGEFPSHLSTAILDEEKALGDRFAGYRWKVEVTEMIGAGAAGTVEIEGGDTHEVLFAEEGGTAEDSGEEADQVQPDQVDRMLFIRVIVYPPNYDEADEDETALKPRSAWTAIHLPPEETEGP